MSKRKVKKIRVDTLKPSAEKRSIKPRNQKRQKHKDQEYRTPPRVIAILQGEGALYQKEKLIVDFYIKGGRTRQHAVNKARHDLKRTSVGSVSGFVQGGSPGLGRNS